MGSFGWRAPAAVMVVAILIAASLVGQGGLEKDPYTDKILNSLVVPYGTTLVLHDAGALDIREDLVVAGNLTIRGSTQITIADDMWVLGNLSIANGNVDLIVGDGFEVSGRIYVLNGTLSLDVQDDVSLDGVLHADGQLANGQGAGIELEGARVAASGLLQAGHGRGGDHALIPGGYDGLDGAPGGSIVITASESITIDGGILIPGDGGRGGLGASSAGAGGNGGAAGIIELSAPDIAFNGTAASSVGGDGGSAVSVGTGQHEATGGAGGAGGAFWVRAGDQDLSLASGSWNLSATNSSLLVYEHELAVHHPTNVNGSASLISPADGESTSVIDGLASRVPVEVTHHGELPGLSSCLPYQDGRGGRAPTYHFTGGRGGHACAEGLPGPAGQKGADGQAAPGPLDSCSNGASGTAPASAGSAGGSAVGGDGGPVAVGLSGSGGNAMSIGGAGGAGGNGGAGGDGAATSDGCDGGDGAPGGTGGRGGLPSPGDAGSHDCGVSGAGGGAGSMGGAGGDGGEAGAGGAGGPLGSPGTSGTSGAQGAYGNFTGGSSGDRPSASGGASCVGLLVSDVNNTTKSLSWPSGDDTLYVGPKGHFAAPAVVTGTIDRDWLHRNNTTYWREVMSGPEIQEWANASHLHFREAVGPALVDPTADDAYHDQRFLWFFESSQHENLSDALDWRQYVPNMGILGDMFETGIYESDHWTYSHGCKKPSRGAAGTSALLAWDAAFAAVEDPCPDGKELTKGKRKLPLNLQWNVDVAAMSYIADTFQHWGYRLGCEGSVRVIEVYYGHDLEPVYAIPTASFVEELDEEACHAQNHVRAYEIIPGELVVGQAHFEHWHRTGWFICNYARHCVHDISNLEKTIGDEFDAYCWDSDEATNAQVTGGTPKWKGHNGTEYKHNYRLTHMDRTCYP